LGERQGGKLRRAAYTAPLARRWKLARGLGGTLSMDSVAPTGRRHPRWLCLSVAGCEPDVLRAV